MNNFLNKKCTPSAEIKCKIDQQTAVSYLKDLENWSLEPDDLAIKKRFIFKNFKQTMFFINAVAFLCEKECHHPHVNFSYNFCEILLTTHDVGGLSENDFICASKIESLLDN